MTDRFGSIGREISSSVALAAVVTALYFWTLVRIRAYRPDYPDLVVLGLFTPPQPIHLPHALFPVLFFLASAVVVAVSLRVGRSKSALDRRNGAFRIYWVLTGAFVVIFVWAGIWARNASAMMRHLR